MPAGNGVRPQPVVRRGLRQRDWPGRGEPVALADRCPHRGLPLSHGVRDGDTLRCGYHGMAFGRSGACVAVPSQASVPTGMGVHA